MANSTVNTWQKVSAVAIVLFVNVLFIGKYAARYIPHAWAHAALYAGLAVIACMLWEKKNWRIGSVIITLLGVIIILSSILILKYIPVEKLKVDRWSVIYSFFTELKSGHYPYGAISNMNNSPGPLPVYFAAAYPFYLIGEIAYMPILALGLFIYYMLRKSKREGADYSFAILLLLFSPFIYWEIFARSTIFFFSLLWFIYAEKLLESKVDNWKRALIGGVLGGLLLSTRFVYAIILCVYGIYLLKQKVKLSYLLGWGITVLVVFGLTILPLYLMFPAEFAKSNPFHTESSSFMPFWCNFLFIPIAIGCGLLARNNSQGVFFSGVALFLTVLVYFLFRIGADGWHIAFYESSADISYFILPIPFLLGILSKKVKIK